MHTVFVAKHHKYFSLVLSIAMNLFSIAFHVEELLLQIIWKKKIYQLLVNFLYLLKKKSWASEPKIYSQFTKRKLKLTRNHSIVVKTRFASYFSYIGANMDFSNVGVFLFLFLQIQKLLRIFYGYFLSKLSFLSMYIHVQFQLVCICSYLECI